MSSMIIEKPLNSQGNSILEQSGLTSQSSVAKRYVLPSNNLETQIEISLKDVLLGD